MAHKLRIYPGDETNTLLLHSLISLGYLGHAFRAGLISFAVGTLISVNYTVYQKRMETERSRQLLNQEFVR